jgi:hypothetical protein
MSEKSKKLQPQAPMFAAIGEEASLLDYPGKILQVLIIVPFAVIAVAIMALPQLAVQLIRLPFTARAKRLRRNERRVKLEKAGRLISHVTFEEHSSCGEGLAIRDLEGYLWWAKDIPEVVREAEERSQRLNLKRRQIPHQRFLRLYELREWPKEETDRIMELNYAYLVDIPGGRMPRTAWSELAREGKITMLSFQFKD